MSEVKYVEFLNFLNFGGGGDEKQLVGLRQASGRRQKALIGDKVGRDTQMALMRDGALSSCLLLSLDDGEKMTDL